MRAGSVHLVPLLLVTLSLLPATVHAEDEDPHTRWQAAREAAVERLHELASWCASAKLFATRAVVYENVLAFEPDDKVARKWLRYKRASDGSWKRKPGYTPPRDRSRAGDRYAEKRAVFDEWFAGEALALLEASSDVALRSRILTIATSVVPGSEPLRLANGEVRVGEGEDARWQLVESQLARTRRRELKKAATAAIDAVPAPKAGLFITGDDADRVEWGKVLQGERVRVLGTPDDKEMKAQYEYCEACWPVYRAAIRLDPPTWSSLDRYARGMSVYVFDDIRRGNAFLARQPDVPERYRQFTESLAALWIPKRAAVLVKSGVPLARLEGGPKQILGGMSASLFGIGSEEGWLSEALDHYLVYLITGTRILSSVSDPKSRYGRPQPGLPDVTPRAIDQDDWLSRGLALLESEEKPEFFLMVGKNINDLDVNDVLYAYCLVAYLIEGRPQVCADFLRAVGEAKSVDLEAHVQRHLGFDVAMLETRVRRWLVETTR